MQYTLSFVAFGISALDPVPDQIAVFTKIVIVVAKAIHTHKNLTVKFQITLATVKSAFKTATYIQRPPLYKDHLVMSLV